MEYCLCEARTVAKLERTVNQLLGAGWRPTGGVSVTQSHKSSHWWYYQAMVRDQEPPRPVVANSGELAKPPTRGFGDFD